jgi:carboxypeptidase D
MAAAMLAALLVFASGGWRRPARARDPYAQPPRREGGSLRPPAQAAAEAPAKEAEGYATYEEVGAYLTAAADAYPELCRLETLGQSVEGRDIWALMISDSPQLEEDEPECKFVSTMHGDEPVGTELLLNLIDLLLTDYGSDPRITALVDETVIWLVPLMNPDGYARDNPWRWNANGYDLNRSFPKWPSEFSGTVYDGAPLGAAEREPEVAAVMAWSAGESFSLAANFHTGVLVVNYPYDDDGKGSVYSASPDDALFRHISLAYATENAPMSQSEAFPGGITNGAAWYAISGGMQDWNYRYLGCPAVTVELSDVETPPIEQIESYWLDNREAMLTYLEQSHTGLRGVVTDAGTGAPVYAQVTVAGNAQPVFTDPGVGDYHRLLLPGTYAVTVSAPGYVPATVTGVEIAGGPAARLDVQLEPDLDTDRDGMPDDWERAHGLEVGRDDSGEDEDGDLLTHLEEYGAGTLPNEPDTDGDGVWDGVETLMTFDPLDAASSPLDLDAADGPNAVDLQLVVRAVLGLDDLAAADVNRSGTADAVDIQLMVRAILGLDVNAALRAAL